MRYILAATCGLISLLILAGCSERVEPTRPFQQPMDVHRSLVGYESAAPVFDAMNFNIASGRMEVFLCPSDAAPTSMEQEQAADAPQVASPDRKIIYTANVGLVVESFEQTQERIDDLVQGNGGYVAQSELHRTDLLNPWGTWVVRVPVEKFDLFLDALAGLGVPETWRKIAQDVTEEYVDLEARLRNKREIETRILKLLDDRSGEIKDVIVVEKELGRVREEIERMEGRHRYLEQQSAMTTATITVREERRYVAHTFAARVGNTWGGTLDSLQGAGQALLLATIATGPWLVVIAAVVLPALWFYRRRTRSVVGEAVS